jgi:hypothetical protein
MGRGWKRIEVQIPRQSLTRQADCRQPNHARLPRNELSAKLISRQARFFNSGYRA